MMQAKVGVCHQCGSSREKDGINFKKESSNDDRPALMDVWSVVRMCVFVCVQNWFQGCSFLICEGSLAVEATAF